MRIFGEQLKKQWCIVAYSTIITLVVLGSIWVTTTRVAHRKTTHLLMHAAHNFVNVENYMVDLWLEATAVSLTKYLGTARHLSPEQFQELNAIFPIGRIAIVDSDGRILNAAVDSMEGCKLQDVPQAAQFMECIAKQRFISQPFRTSTSTPSQICKYAAYPFPDGSGLVGVGCAIEVFNEHVENRNTTWISEESFGEYGKYYLVENALMPLDESRLGADALALRKSISPEERTVFECELPLMGKCYGLQFNYSIYRLVAVIPYKEFFVQRDVFFRRSALYLLFFAVPMTIILVWLMNLLEKNKQIAEREKEAQLLDMKRAQTIQTSFLTQAEHFMNEEMRLRIYAKLIPAQVVGGDTYCFFPFDNERVGLFIADVSGKGIPAAIFVMYFRGLLRNNILSGNHDLAEAVTKTNEHLCQHNDAEMFVTCWIGVLNLANGILEYINAGHNYPYIRHADGALEMVKKRGGLFLGMFPEATYKMDDMQLQPGDRLFLYTDGVTEAMNAEKRLFGRRRLEETLARRDGLLCEHVVAEVRQFSGEVAQSDDVTILEVAWHGEPERVALTLDASEESLEKAMAFLQEKLAALEKGPRMRLMNAADECVSNIVYYSKATRFTMTVESSPDRCRLILEDDGTPYNPLTHTDPKVHVPIEERPVGGLGILISKKLMDKVSYTFVEAKNCLSLLVFRTDNKG